MWGLSTVSAGFEQESSLLTGKMDKYAEKKGLSKKETTIGFKPFNRGRIFYSRNNKF